MRQEVDYDYDEVIQFCQREGQNSINDLANSLNELSSEMDRCQDAFHSKANQLVIGDIYKAFSTIIGSTASNSGVAGLDAESAKIINICYSEAMNDKRVLESDILGGSENLSSPASSLASGNTTTGQENTTDVLTSNPANESGDSQELEEVTTESVEAKTAQASPETQEVQTLTQDTPTPTKSSWDGPVLTKRMGVNQGPNGKETYYNLNMNGVVKIMHDQGFEGEYWVREDGVKMFGDYVMVAANLDVHPRGSVIDSSLGKAIVCDTGGFAKDNPNQIDIATSW